MCRNASHPCNRRILSRNVRRAARRRGVTAVESAVLLSTLLMVLFVIFDFGLATFQYNTLSAVARRVARVATLHGEAAAPQQTAWGPGEYVGTAADGSEIASAAAPLLATMPASQVTIDVTWLDRGNQENNRVRVMIKYTHHSWVPFLPTSETLNLQAESTMPIVH